jgi:hypothetical protein
VSPCFIRIPVSRAPVGPGPVSPLSRWSELTSAAKAFLEVLGHFGQNTGTFGIIKISR